MDTLGTDPLERPFALSAQEERVLTLSMAGLGDKEIAQALSLSFGTVRTYWKRIQGKVGGATRAEIVTIFTRTSTGRELQNERALNARLQAELVQRRESEAKYRAILASAPIGIVVSAPNGDCIYVNPAWERVTGVPRALAMGGRWGEIVHADDFGRLSRWWREGAGGPTEFRILSPGGVLWVRSTISPMMVEGRVQGHIVTIEDVGARRTQARSEDR